MFMERIEVAAGQSIDRKSLALKALVGSAFLLFLLLIMPPYLLALAIWSSVVLVARLAADAVREIYAAVLYAGEAVLGP